MNSTVLSKYSIGVGDRFAHQAKAQLAACIQAARVGVDVIPVWNKSNREHTIIGSSPGETRAAVEAAVHDLHWTEPYHLDADHINHTNVDRFLDPCDFFTIDVADLIGQPAAEPGLEAFVARHPELARKLSIPGIEQQFETDADFLERTARKYLAAIQEAEGIYAYIAEKRGKAGFITEISMDETNSPQNPVELLIILAAVADAHIPVQTIAPKFTGRFNKGVDYSGDLAKFSQEFSNDIAVIAFAVKQYGLPANLKLSVHSGSDKFSLYEPMRVAIKKFDAGLHIKTAGTTWLEELIGLAESGGQALALAKEIYAQAYLHRDELCAPYATVIDIDPARLPPPREVNAWSSEQFVSALRHDGKSPAYNSSLRQLLHVGFKVAAKMEHRYTDLLTANESIIARNVTENLFARHIQPIFIGDPAHAV